MQVNRTQATLLRKALEHWNQAGLLADEVAASLSADIEVIRFDWKKLAKYSFWAALVCIVISVGALFADQALLELLRSIFSAPYIVKFLFLAAMSALFYWYGFLRQRRFPARIFSNEAILFLAVMLTAGAIYQLGRAFDSGSGHFSILLLLSFAVYGVLGFSFRSNLIWLFALVSLGSWMGTETGYMSGWGAYYLGMNYPLRFVLFGLILTLLALVLEKARSFEHFFRSTLAMGLLYLFIALWIMSIFGNYGDINAWQQVKQSQLFYWSILFGVAAIAAIYHGLRYENAMTKGFGIT